MSARIARALLACVVALSTAAAGLAPDQALAEGFRFRTLPVVAESGLFDGDPKGPREAWSTTVRAPGAAVVRVAFAEAQLGASSFVTIRSLADGAVHRLDAKSLPEWGRMSALMNGEAAEVTLHVAPGDKDVFVRLAGVLGSEPPTRVDSQCGPNDDRVPSTDNRVARISPTGCTAWRVGNGAFLTAGHCADDDPDDGGPQLPNGVLDWNANTVIEFNVPDSQANGTAVSSAPQDQYPVVLNSVQWVFAGNGMPLGNDWCVFRVGANSNTGLLPHQVYGLPFRITREMPANATNLRVTGFGIDTGVDNSTNQTMTGALNGETLGTGTARINHVVDTEQGNSGSPIIWENNQFCLGIHTNAGCQTDGTGSNAGTSFELDALENAINGFPGAGTIYVDSGHTLVINQDGTLMRPIWTMGGGISTVVTGGRISVYPGTYNVSTGTVISKAMTIEAPVGTVTIATP